MSRMLSAFAALAICAAAVASPALAQERFVFEGKALKTAPASAARISPFWDEFAAYEDAVTANKGKPPGDASARIKKLRAMAGPMVAEAQGVAARAKAAGETDVLDKAFVMDMKKLGEGDFAQKVQAMGGFSQVAANVAPMVDADIKSLSRGVAQNSVSGVLAELFGATPAEARMRYGTCVFFAWLTPGVSADTAYKICKRYP